MLSILKKGCSMDSIIFYHDDLDGLLSALGFAYNDYKQKFPAKCPNYKDLKKHYLFYEVHYGIKDIFEILDKQKIDINCFKKAVIVDFCFDRETMSKLLSILKKKLIWIDHHRNLITELSDLEITGIRDTNHSASVLVWKYFGKEPTLFSEYVQDMDFWAWKLPDSRDALQYICYLYLQTHDREANRESGILDEFIRLFNNEYFKKCLPVFKEYGKLMNSYVNTKVKDDVSTGSQIMFEGISSFVVNTQLKSGYVSDYIFNSKNYKGIELVIVWYRYYGYENGEYQKPFDKVSLRSKNIDCSIIAKKYGGNGHPKASGFVCDDISKLL